MTPSTFVRAVAERAFASGESEDLFASQWAMRMRILHLSKEHPLGPLAIEHAGIIREGGFLDDTSARAAIRRLAVEMGPDADDERVDREARDEAEDPYDERNEVG